MSIYVPYDEGGAYPWNVGLAASGNHIRPYGVSLPSDPCLTFVDQEASLLESNEDQPTGYIEAPEGVDVNYSYLASTIYVDPAKSTVKGKAEGISEITVTLTLDGVELARAIRPVEVMHGVMPLAPDLGASWEVAQESPSGHLIDGRLDSILVVGKGTNTDGHLIFPTSYPVLSGKGFNPPFNVDSVYFGDIGYWTSLGKDDSITRDSLVSVEMPDGSVSRINHSAFKDSPNLKRLVFGSTVTAIEPAAFNGCPSISEIVVKAPKPISVQADSFDDIVKKNAYVRVLDTGTAAEHESCMKAWRDAGFSHVVTISSVGDVFWSKDRTLKYTITQTAQNFYPGFVSVSQGDSAPTGVLNIPTMAQDEEIFGTHAQGTYLVKEIGDNAFSGCTGLTSLVTDYTLKSIGTSAFSGCTNLASADISSAITTFGSNAFQGCSSLAEVVYLEGAPTDVGKDAFAGTSAKVYCSQEAANAFNAAGATAVVHSVSLSPTTSTVVVGGSAATITASSALLSSTFGSEATLVWENSNNDVVTLVGSGMSASVTAKAKGSSTVTAKLKGDGVVLASATCEVTAAVPCTVTFDYNDGATASKQVVVNSGSAVAEPVPAPTRPGYDFTGWYTAKTGGSKWDFSTAIEEDRPLYAQWTLKNHSVTFKYNDGTTADTVKTINHGSTVTAPPDPQRTGYGFAGWFTEAEGGSKVTFPVTVTGQLVYHAHWTLNTYTVTFDHNDGTGTKDTATVGHGLTITEPLQPKRTGYEFAGWHTQKGAYSPWDFATGVTGKTDLYAHWTLKKFAYTLGTAKGVDAGSSATPSGTYDYNSTITLDAVAKTGYEFKGWKSSDTSLVADQAKANTTFTMPAGALTMTPTAAPISYSITFNLNDGNPLVNPPSSYNIESQPITLPTPTRANHTFAGWYDNRDFNNVSITAIPTGSHGDKTFWAKWTIDKRTVTFDTKGGSTIDPVQVDHGSAIAAPTPDPTKDGFVFGGWYTNEQCTNEYDFSAQVTSDITLYAKWVDATPLVFTLNPDGESLSVSVNPAVRNTITSVNIPSVYELEGRKLPVTEIFRAVKSEGILGGFQGCAKLERVLLPDGLLVLGDAAFADCPLLSSVALPDSLVEIAGSAFKKCESLTSLDIPGKVTKVGSYAFLDCSLLESVSLPESLTYLGPHAFKRCSRLTEIVIPSGVTAIEDETFVQSGLTSVSLPSTLASIGSLAFSGCIALNHVALPDGLVSLGESAFVSSGLTAIDLPASVASIGANAFADCGSLASVFAHGSMVESGAANAFDANAKQRAKVFLPLMSADGTETFDQMAAAWGTATGGHGFANVHATGGDLPMVDNIGAVNWSFEVTDQATGLGTLTIEQTDSGTIDYLADWTERSNDCPTADYWSPLRPFVSKVVMKSIDGRKMSARDTSYWFASMHQLTDVSEAYIPDDTVKAKFMFDDCTSLESVPDTMTLPDTLVNTAAMFRGAKLKEIPPSMVSMPAGIMSINSMYGGNPIRSLPETYTLEHYTQLSNVGWAFSGTDLVAIPTGFRFPENSITVYQEAFSKCKNLVSIPEGFTIPVPVEHEVRDGKFTTPKLTLMFSACEKLTYLPKSLDLQALKNAEGVEGFDSMFRLKAAEQNPVKTYFAGDLGDISPTYWIGRELCGSSTGAPAGSTLVSFMLPDASGNYASEPWSKAMTDASGMLTELIPELREGLAFAGWYVDAACTQAFDFTKSVTAQGGVAANPVDKLYGRYVQASGDLPTTDGAQNAHWELDRSGTLKIWCEPGCTVEDLGWDNFTRWEGHWGPLRSQVKRVQMDPDLKAESVALWFANMNQLVDATGIFVPEGAVSTRGMLRECATLAKLPDGFTIPEGVIDAFGTVRQCPELTTIPDSFRLPQSVQDVSSMFEATGIVSLPAGFTITDNVTAADWMFQSCRNLVNLPEGFSLPESGSLKSVRAMFNMAASLQSLPEGFTVPQSVNDCEAMLAKCRVLTALPEGFSLPVRADLNAKWMFQACNSLTVLPTSLNFKELFATGWDVTANAQEMFIVFNWEIPQPLPTIYMGSAENIPDAAWWSSMHRALYTPNDPNGSPLPEGTHLVKFVVQGAGASPWDDYVTMPTDASGAVSAPGNPSRFGYPFQGWYADPELTVKFDFDTAKIETDDVVVYGKFGPPILRFEAPLSAGVSLDESRTVTTAQVEARSYTPVPVRVESLRCEQGPNAPDVFAEPSKVSATVRLGDAATAVKLPLTGTPASASASLASSTGFSHPSSLTAEVGLDLGGSVVRQTPDGAVDVAHIVWSVGL